MVRGAVLRHNGRAGGGHDSCRTIHGALSANAAVLCVYTPTAVKMSAMAESDRGLNSC